MEFKQATDALEYARSLSSGDMAISSLVFDESVINVEELPFASTYATLKSEITRSLETLIGNMESAIETMRNKVDEVTGTYQVPIGYEKKYSESGGIMQE